ncbi:hypothetical protein AVEN_215343-1 [Araneus ventricosus]|uniref:Uncharacterized protein n=1 Tax=Araneus ventricosus TaxID=182803 RepID=A0A4Y2GDM9_ARAVE|nr:hypothetical protein AVEN_215343-1 [Araneus ventricosus]
MYWDSPHFLWPSDHLMFLQENVRWLHKPPQVLEQVPLLCKNRAAILIKIFVWFRKPPERRKELHPLCRKGAVLVKIPKNRDEIYEEVMTPAEEVPAL